MQSSHVTKTGRRNPRYAFLKIEFTCLGAFAFRRLTGSRGRNADRPRRRPGASPRPSGDLRAHTAPLTQSSAQMLCQKDFFTQPNISGKEKRRDRRPCKALPAARPREGEGRGARLVVSNAESEATLTRCPESARICAVFTQNSAGFWEAAGGLFSWTEISSKGTLPLLRSRPPAHALLPQLHTRSLGCRRWKLWSFHARPGVWGAKPKKETKRADRRRPRKVAAVGRNGGASSCALRLLQRALPFRSAKETRGDADGPGDDEAALGFSRPVLEASAVPPAARRLSNST